MFLHGIEEFAVVRGDTLARPAFLQHDALRQFDVVLANPPYSIKSWNRDAFVNDPYGRNVWGTPPQGCADYAFQQHIKRSLDPQTGRYAILWPHGILFREMEAEMRRNMVLGDTVEAVIGLGPNLFYNSPMEAMILIGNMNKSADRRGKLLFVDAKEMVVESKGQAELTDEHIESIFQLYKNFNSVPGQSYVATIDEVIANDGNMNIKLYTSNGEEDIRASFASVYRRWNNAGNLLNQSMEELFTTFDSNPIQP